MILQVKKKEHFVYVLLLLILLFVIPPWPLHSQSGVSCSSLWPLNLPCLSSSYLRNVIIHIAGCMIGWEKRWPASTCAVSAHWPFRESLRDDEVGYAIERLAFAYSQNRFEWKCCSLSLLFFFFHSGQNWNVSTIIACAVLTHMTSPEHGNI